MANLGRVFRGVEYPSRCEACQARHQEYVRALADGLTFTGLGSSGGLRPLAGGFLRIHRREDKQMPCSISVFLGWA